MDSVISVLLRIGTNVFSVRRAGDAVVVRNIGQRERTRIDQAAALDLIAPRRDGSGQHVVGSDERDAVEGGHAQ